MIDTVAEHRPNGRIGLLLEPGPGLDTPTEPAAWQIAIEERRLPWSVETIVVRPGDLRLREARFLAPFPTLDPRASEGCAAEPGAEGARPLRNASPDGAGGSARPCEALTLLVTTDAWLSEHGADRSISRAWLTAHPHEELARWTLPAGQTALLVRTP
jgi:hypothetical protein